jgi:hypothetical protein
LQQLKEQRRKLPSSFDVTQDQNYIVSTFTNTSSPYAQRLDAQISEIENQIKQYDKYFLTEGRKHDAIAKHMFSSDRVDALDKAYINFKFAKDDADMNIRQYNGNFWDNVVATGKNLIEPIKAGLTAAGGTINWAL